MRQNKPGPANEGGLCAVAAEVNTADILGNVFQTAKAYLLAKSRFNRAYYAFWANCVQPCDDETGYRLLVIFRKHIQRFVFELERRDLGVKHAAGDVFRQTLTGEADYSFEQAMGFVKWYEALKNKIGRSIGHLYEYHGDSFEDLCDSYPLAGQELVARALASHPQSSRPRREGFLDEREVGDAVLDKHGLRWHKFICCGENYVESALESAAKNCWLYRVLTGREEQCAWTPEEQEAVSFAHVWED
jgi:hypothetical protein